MIQLTRRKVVIAGAAAFVAAPLDPLSVTGVKAAAPQHHIVKVEGFAFVPDDLKVRVGDTVTWINCDIAPHTATALDTTWDTSTLEQGQSRKLVIIVEMSGPYFCQHHPMMRGKLTLQTD
ncbi:hypothetical protein N9L47_13255 [Rhodobacteraceae bacterium]|nr:hypothetical protein [Paracoccaceae bacterium]